MTKNAVIERLFTSKNFTDCISKMEPAHLRDDLKQEVALVMCSLPEDQLLQLHKEGRVEFYTVRVIVNMVSNKYGSFHKKFRQTFYEYLDDNPREDDEEGKGYKIIPSEPTPDFHDREIQEQIEDTALAAIDSLYWYDAELVRLYMKHGNFRALETETGIPFISCYKTVKKALGKLKNIATGKPVPVFSKEELHFIQNNQP